MYFISFSLGSTKINIANEKENYNFIRDKAATNIHCTYIQFLFDNNASFRKLNFLFIFLQHTATKL